MPRGFGIEQLEPEEQKHHTEFTLGPVMLLAMLCGLLLVCGLFFELGYRAGRQSIPAAGVAVTRTETGQTLSAAAGNSLSKPPAKGLVPATLPAQIAVQPTQQGPLGGTPAANALTSYAPTVGGASAPAGPPQVRSALPLESNGAPASSLSATGYQVQPALAQGARIMVQIAAVSHPEDANVLMGALRKRGYAVVSRRDPADNLIHVQVGPFANRNDAVAMSRKLLGDGYNAQVLP